ncbi:hypothetical protein CR513_22285, partial [Mucuna pruriens]
MTYRIWSHYQMTNPSLVQSGYSRANWTRMITSNGCQMHFLNGIINEEIFVKQPPDFESDTFSNYVFKLKKALYGLKQAPCVWYEKLSLFLMTNGFQREKVDTTLFHKNYDLYFIIVQIYVDNLIFCATNDSLYGEFSKLM